MMTEPAIAWTYRVYGLHLVTNRPVPGLIALSEPGIDALPGLTADELPRVLSAAEKRYLDLTLDGNAPRWRFRREPHPLAAVYVLDERNQGGALSIRTLAQAESLITLTRNTYADYMLDRVGRARDFKLLGRLAATVPLRHVEHPEGLDALPRLCEAILDDFRTLS